MIYHWDRISDNQKVLYEAGHFWTGPLSSLGIAADINKMGQYLGKPNPTYHLSGPLAEQLQARDFDSWSEAMDAVEAIVTASGDTNHDPEKCGQEEQSGGFDTEHGAYQWLQAHPNCQRHSVTRSVTGAPQWLLKYCMDPEDSGQAGEPRLA
jgi:hypothetical protein